MSRFSRITSSEEDPSGQRPVDDLGAREFGLQHRDVYVEADLQLKEDALRKLEPLGQRTRRFKADSSLLAFLASL